LLRPQAASLAQKAAPGGGRRVAAGAQRSPGIKSRRRYAGRSGSDVKKGAEYPAMAQKAEERPPEETLSLWKR
jgi:hypothetical protein